MDTLKSACVAVTGGANGIGYAACEAFAAAGANVAILDVSADAGLAARTKLTNGQSHLEDSVIFVRCDVAREADVDNALEYVRARFGGLDVLLNNAGIGGEHHDLEKITAVNVGGVVHGVRQGLRMRKNGAGPRVIINVASTAGLFPFDVAPNYAATKHAVVGYSLSVRGSAKKAGVTVHCICPSFTDTPMVRSGSSEKDFAKWVEKIGIMEPSTVAGSILKLCHMSEPALVMCTSNDPFIVVRQRAGKL